MTRFIIPIITVLLAILIYGASIAYDHYLTITTVAQKTAIPKAVPTQNTSKNLGTVISDFNFTTLDGQQKNIRDLRGSVVLLNFWATWCAPCVIEFPELLDITDQYKGRVILVALSSDQTKDAIQTFMTSQINRREAPLNPQTVLIAHDQNRQITRNIFNITTYPETLIIARDGTIARHVIGIDDWKTPSLKNLIQKLVNNK